MGKPDIERPTANVFPSDEEVAQRAFELCFRDRAADGQGDYLRMAEQELLNRAARRALRRWSRLPPGK
jgi:hypothetical protein